ncbi:MAG: putative baseplate assembly protein [Actinomycetota bacterium]
MAGTHPQDCDCCSGVHADTPARIDNPPGQPSIAYRAGVHGRFRASLHARLSDPELPVLAGLTTRDDGDLTVALCDALATTLDVLTFYQQRIANENYLRTATERRSILELSRLIGYELAPGVAASTFLAFTLQEVPGSPALAAGPVVVPVGSRVQSVPGPGESPQAFETVEPAEARAEWNAIPVQTTIAWHPQMGDRELWLAGTSGAVGVGDVLLIVGQARVDFPGSEEWDVRVVSGVEPDMAAGRTRITWEDPLGSLDPFVPPAGAGATVHVFRQRAALFGHNAPDPQLLSRRDNNLNNLASTTQWYKFKILGDEFDLDADYPRIVPGSWVALRKPKADKGPPVPRGYVELYRAEAVEYLTRSAFGISSKVTRIRPDTTEHLSTFALRETVVHAQSEEVLVDEVPLRYPLYGVTLALGRLAPGLAPGRFLALSGKAPRIRLARGKTKRKLELPGETVTVSEGDSLRLAGPPEKEIGPGQWSALPPEAFGDILAQPGSVKLRLTLVDRDGRQGTMVAPASAVELGPAFEKDQVLSEIVEVGNLPGDVVPGRDRTTFTLARATRHCYDRTTTFVSANVARATHGETTDEVLGSGDARRPNLAFRLRRSPLTYVKAATPTGRRSTLEVRANDLLWAEADTLYAKGPGERVYEVSIDDKAQATVKFGDSVEGARPPSGDHNLRARYRHGIGLAGNVPAGKITNLLSRPLGVTGATNPEAAEGGEDPEIESRARSNAPLTVRTLDRAVSVRDYQDFARSFSSIAKAHALWVPSGPGNGIFVTVAGENGKPVEESGDTYRFLHSALRTYGDAVMPLHLVSYSDVRFRVRLSVKVAPDAEATLVLPGIDGALRTRFGFEARGFGQPVTIDEVTALAQSVKGVEAVNVTELWRLDAPAAGRRPILFALLPVASLTERPDPAELLTIEDGPVTLDVMP